MNLSIIPMIICSKFFWFFKDFFKSFKIQFFLWSAHPTHNGLIIVKVPVTKSVLIINIHLGTLEIMSQLSYSYCIFLEYKLIFRQNPVTPLDSPVEIKTAWNKSIFRGWNLIWYVKRTKPQWEQPRWISQSRGYRRRSIANIHTLVKMILLSC